MKTIKCFILALFLSSFAFGQTLTDVDGNTYPTVKIGKQTWSAQNMRASRGKDGESLNYIASSDINMGYLYDWNSACKVCPQGWRLPKYSDFEELIAFYGGEGVAGEKMKAKDAIGFVKFSAIDEFKAYAAGVGHPDTRKINFRPVQVYDVARAYFWTQTEEEGNNANAWYLQLMTSFSEATMFANLKTGYQSVRCVKE